MPFFNILSSKPIKFKPIIKWSGSKRSQCNEIIKYFHRVIDTYYEPFCGGASMARCLMESGIPVQRYVLSDKNPDLIALWNLIKTDPMSIYEHYKTLWDAMNSSPNLDYKKAFFNDVRARFNECRDPKDFMFIMRTTTNGMPRYNANGEFNNSFHVTRNGIVPESLRDILMDWHGQLNRNKVEFRYCSFDEISPKVEDFVYLDPPYANTKGMYYGSIDNEKLWNWMRNLPCNYVLSFDGISGNVDSTYAVPTDLYSRHIYVTSGNSSFKRIIGKTKDAIVRESLYIKD